MWFTGGNWYSHRVGCILIQESGTDWSQAICRSWWLRWCVLSMELWPRFDTGRFCTLNQWDQQKLQISLYVLKIHTIHNQRAPSLQETEIWVRSGSLDYFDMVVAMIIWFLRFWMQNPSDEQIDCALSDDSQTTPWCCSSSRAFGLFSMLASLFPS